MNSLEKKFQKLGVDNAPGQQVRQNDEDMFESEKIPGTPIDFSHGDVDAFTPIPGTLNIFNEGVLKGAEQAYTEYRGKPDIRDGLAKRITNFIGLDEHINSDKNLIITPGTQGALFLAMGATIDRGDKIAIVFPDYYANRRIVEFFDGQVIPIELNYMSTSDGGGLNLEQLESSFKSGVKCFVFSNPNNPTGANYSQKEIREIAFLAQKYNVTVIVDELYSRQIFDGRKFSHLLSQNILNRDNIITIMGPSKTESLSGYRVGVAFGSPYIINRMEKLQGIMSIRPAGYNQSVLRSWFSEPEGWLQERINQHQKIRDGLVNQFRSSKGFKVRPTEAGSYLFPTLPDISISLDKLIKILRVKASVAVTPGTEFGKKFTNSFRINFSQDYKIASLAIDRLLEVVEDYRIY